MKLLCRPIPFQTAYPIDRLGPKHTLLFFDIETTGFSGEKNQVYLIGCIGYDPSPGQWTLSQWFADTPDSEAQLLTHFFTFLSGYSRLIHFNGDAFDLPFLQKRCRHYRLPYDFSQIETVDLYRKIRPWKTILGLTSLKQKSIELFLGVLREDQYSGGELITVYQDYLSTQDPDLYRLLILHNEEDLMGMPQLLPILSYPDLLSQPLSLAQQALHSPDQEPPWLALTCQLSSSLPVPFEAQGALPSSALSGEGSQLSFRVPLYQGELKYFYPNYQDYYYLPWEDMAIHKSVGEYVSGKARKQATAKTCYTRKEGCFLPQITPVFQPVFRECFGGKLAYALYDPTLLQEEKAASAYLRQLLPIQSPSH